MQTPIVRKKLELTEIAIPIAVIHALALLAFLPDFFNVFNVVATGVAVLIFGQGINLAYHRLLAHRSLQVPKWLEYAYVALAICSLEETPAKWVSTHRRHHFHSDEEDDPHSPVAGFWWSHIGWLLFKRGGEAEFRVDEKHSADILKDPVYAWLERNPLIPGLMYLLHAVVIWLAALVTFQIAGLSLAESSWQALGTLSWVVVLRTVVVWHITWSVNSLTHRFGYQNYSTGELSRNNWLVALLASGEGWHNNHHHDPASASVQHRWWELDLTYCHIRVLEFLGLARKVIRPRHIRKPAQPGAGDSEPRLVSNPVVPGPVASVPADK